MRIALCQINTTVGALDDNARHVVDAVFEAHGQGATLAVFPELTLTGYPPRDLLDRPAFVERNLATLKAVAQAVPADIEVLVGFVDTLDIADRDTAAAPHLYNAAALIRGGQVVQRFHKRLLPYYDVFDELRYFAPGSLPLTFEHAGRRVGVLICEDGWNSVDGPLRRSYAQDPVAACMDEGAELLVNLSASPFTLAKRDGRCAMFGDVARGAGVPLALVNLVGATDDLIFDGSSAMYGEDGSLWARARRFSPEVLVCDVAPGGRIAPQAQTDAGAALDALVAGVRDYADKCGFSQALVGLSGGVDSALVAAIAAQALTPGRVLAVGMPTRYSSEGSLSDARALVEALGIGFRLVDIDAVFQAHLDQLTPVLEGLGPAPEQDTTFENVQARIRGLTLMAISNRFGHLLLTTGNKSEVAVGYCTLYGDMAGGLAVISDLPKTFVYEVCREFNRRAGRDVIPQRVLDKPPSAELRPDQTDQDSLPPYDVLDGILERLIERHEGQAEIIAAGYDAETVARVARLVRISEYKRRQMPPGLIVTSKAFGPGRRYPIAQRAGY